MNHNGHIVIIEDDPDDRELLRLAFNELNYPNKILFFDDGITALDYFESSNESFFLILADINMPKLSGFELRDKIQSNPVLRLKCIPYIFFTTAATPKSVIQAYSKCIQGFFTKPVSYNELLVILKSIIEYWKNCKAPLIL